MPGASHLIFAPNMSDLYRFGLAISFLICVPLVRAQDPDDRVIGNQGSERGLHLYQLATFQEWSSSPFTAITGAVATVDFSNQAGPMRYSFLYSSVYSHQGQSYSRGAGSGFNNLDQFLAFTGAYSLTRGANSLETSRSVLSLSISADVYGTNDSLPPVTASNAQASQTASAPTVLDQFEHNSGSAALYQMLPLLFGGHVLAAHSGLAIEHRRTARLIMGLSVGGNRIQEVSRAPANSLPQQAYGFPVLNTTEADFTVSYLLSQRTRVGLAMSDLEMLSGYTRGRATGVTASVRRLLTSRLQGRLYGGASELSPRHIADTRVPASVQLTFGARLDYKRRSSDIGFSLDRRPLDPYGVGANSILGAIANWQYRGFGRRTSLAVEAGWQKLNSPVALSLQSMQCSAVLTRTLSGQMTAEVGYLFARVITSPVRPISGNLQQIELRLAWKPTNLRLF